MASGATRGFVSSLGPQMPEVKLIRAQRFVDGRGFFMETNSHNARD